MQNCIMNRYPEQQISTFNQQQLQYSILSPRTGMMRMNGVQLSGKQRILSPSSIQYQSPKRVIQLVTTNQSIFSTKQIPFLECSQYQQQQTIERAISSANIRFKENSQNQLKIIQNQNKIKQITASKPQQQSTPIKQQTSHFLNKNNSLANIKSTSSKIEKYQANYNKKLRDLEKQIKRAESTNKDFFHFLECIRH